MLPAESSTRPRLVFVDTETTGLDPAVDRIIEIGVVTVDGGAADEWTTLLNPRTPRALSSRLLQEIGEERARALPRFGEIARTLLQRVGDGILIAHNARFDYAFLRAEFERVGIRFEAEVVCRTERKARNALARLATRHQLCRTLLGLPASEDEVCAACVREPDAAKPEGLRHLTQAYATLLPWKIAPWPYAGPVAIRERRDLHVVDRWRYLGTAQSMQEAHALLENRAPAFDADVYSILLPALSRLPRRRVAVLEGFGH